MGVLVSWEDGFSWRKACLLLLENSWCGWRGGCVRVGAAVAALLSCRRAGQGGWLGQPGRSLGKRPICAVFQEQGRTSPHRP